MSLRCQTLSAKQADSSPAYFPSGKPVHDSLCPQMCIYSMHADVYASGISLKLVFQPPYKN